MKAKCACHGFVCHLSTFGLRPVTLHSKGGGRSKVVLVSEECEARLTVRHPSPEAVRAAVAEAVAAFGRKEDPPLD
jgi:hypothetical protein